MPSLTPFIDNPTDGYPLILMPAGEAIFGSREDEPDSDYDRKPQFRVHLPDYYLGKYPLRNVEYARFLEEVGPEQSDLVKWIQLDSNCQVVEARGGFWVRGAEGKQWEALVDDEEGWSNHPVVQVSWWGAQAYCEWAGMRLPTELEWEKGARGVEGEAYPWGNEWDPSKCRNASNRGSGKTCMTWAYPEGWSVWGQYQMVGTVWGWGGDWYEGNAYQRYAKGDLQPPASGILRVLRGGSWCSGFPRVFRCADRGYDYPGGRYSVVGFRCVRGPL